MSTTNSTSTFSGSPSFPDSAEVTVSLTESGDNPPQQQQVVVQPQPEAVQKPKNQLYEQIPVLSFPPVKKPLVVEQQVSPQLDQKASPVQTSSAQTETPPASPNPQSPAGPSPRVELLTQPQKKPVVKPHPIGTAFFDNTTVTAFDLMPQEMRSSLSGEDDSRDNDFVDTPEPIAENPVWRGMEETKIDPKFEPKYAYVVDLSSDHLPRQTIKREEPIILPKRFDKTIILTTGLISSFVVIGVFFLVRGKKR
uniref:Syndecan n=1 Tax=Meloidogyne javanica TaxID=6303 RepID=A0A915N8A1_MELJA